MTEPVGNLAAVELDSTAPTASPDSVEVSQARVAEAWVSKIGRFVPKPVRHLGRLLIIALIIEYLVIPQIAGSRRAIHLLSHVSPLLLLIGLVLEAASITAYAQLSRSLLPPASDPGLWTILRIQLTTLSVSHCVPGGSAAGSSIGFRLLTSKAGVKGPDAGVALASQGLGSAVVLNVILWVALIVSIPLNGFSPLYLSVAIVGLLLIGSVATLLFLFTRGEEKAGLVVERIGEKLPGVSGPQLRRIFAQLSQRLRVIGQDRSRLYKGTAWAAANWLLDAASLWVFVGAFGHWARPDELLVAYGLANVLAAIPITPGGLGVVEATLSSTLVGFGTTRGIALLGVLSYRLVNFWLPIPVGGVAFLSLQVGHGRSKLKLHWRAAVSSLTSGALERRSR